MRRDLQADIKKITNHMAIGQKKLAITQGIPAADLASNPIRKQLTNLFRAKIVAQLTLEHITKLCKDSARSGERKEAILAKLGAKV